jgi:putative addiction module killer protein
VQFVPAIPCAVVTCTLLYRGVEITVLEFLQRDGRSPFSRWFSALDAAAALKVRAAIARLADGNLSNTKGVGGGVSEQKIDFGPGYRVYFGRDGKALVILLGGGTKQRQERDIADAQARWQDYKARTREQKKERMTDGSH